MAFQSRFVQQNAFQIGIPTPYAGPPFNQYDWFTVYRVKYFADPLFSRQPTPPTPFHQLDWPEVLRGTPAWVEIPPNLALYFSRGEEAPFSLSDWTQAVGRALAGWDLPPNLLTGVLGGQAPPFYQTDWTPTAVRSKYWADPLFARGPPLSAPPFVQSDWPPPFNARWIPAEPVYQSPVVRGIPQPPPPFSLTDWTPAQKWRFMQEVRLYRSPPAPAAALGTPVASLTDWPQVTRPRWIAQADEGANGNFFWQRLAPFNFDDAWPPAQSFKWPGQADYVQSLANAVVPLPSNPFQLTDWPPPFGWKFGQQPLFHRVAGAAPLPKPPFAQLDWPPPFKFGMARFDENWPNQNLGIPLFPPFSQTDWPQIQRSAAVYLDADDVPNLALTPLQQGGDTHDGCPKEICPEDPWVKKRHEEEPSNTQVIRESDLKRAMDAAKRKIAKPEIEAKPNTDDEDLAVLMADEDDRLSGLIELAAKLLKRLH